MPGSTSTLKIILRASLCYFHVCIYSKPISFVGLLHAWSKHGKKNANQEISKPKILYSCSSVDGEALSPALWSVVFKSLCDLLCFLSLNFMKICLVKSGGSPKVR
jgi:hypothetical protein